jgi:sulfur carrier protein ThiS adenylyltransferase
MIKVNEQPVPFQKGLRVDVLVRSIKPDADLFIVNGFPVDLEQTLSDGDTCWLIKRGEVPAPEELDRLLYARHTPGVHERMKNSLVGVMGLGGLGSSVSVALTRMGIGRLILADFDLVDPTNLNRQQYFVDQIGMKKTRALKDNLARINPHVDLLVVEEKLDEQGIIHHFRQADVLVECFDDSRMKAVALRTVLRHLPGVAYVGASGVAGCGPNNAIRTSRLFDRVYLVGDGVSAAAPGEGLMAPRVGVAAHHQANQVVRILLGLDEGDRER